MNKALFSTGKDDWETPPELFKALDDEFHFSLDPCCTPVTAKCKKYYTTLEDGLAQSWAGEVVFINPPYSRESSRNPHGQAAWIRKAYEESAHATCVLLIPARTDTATFHDLILGKAEIRFLRGRLKFVGAKDPAPFPSMVVIYRNRENDNNIRKDN